MSKKTIIIVVVVLVITAGVIWYAVKGKEYFMSVDAKRKALNEWSTVDPTPTNAFNEMNDAEIKTAYTFVFDYFKKNKKPTGDLAAKIIAISDKYGIFG